MSRQKRINKFNKKIEEDYFNRILNIYMNNIEHTNIVCLLNNFEQFYDNLEWIDRVLEISSEEQYKMLDWKKISKHKNMNLDFIDRHLNKNFIWGEYGLSSNQNLKLEWIEKYPKKNWCWFTISQNPISQNPNFREEWKPK